MSSGRDTDVNRLVLGTATFIDGYGIPGVRHDPSGVAGAAIDAGVRAIDTAAIYGGAEEVIGQLAASRSLALRITTKVEAMTQDDAPAITRKMLSSIDRLQGHCTTMLLHNATGEQAAWPTVAEALIGMKASGHVSTIGASTYGLRAALAALRQPWCDVIQIEFSLLHQAVLRGARVERRPGQRIEVRSVLCKGLLTTRRHRVPELLAPVAQTVDKLEGLAHAWGFSLPQLALRFALDEPGVDAVVIGVSSHEELEEALAVTRTEPLSPARLIELQGLDRSECECVHPERWPSRPQ